MKTLFAGLLTALIAHSAEPVKQTVVYKTVGDLKIEADIYVYNDNKVRPAVVWLHGGALIMGRRDDRSIPWRQAVLTNDLVLVSLDYRLAPQAKLPAIIEDIEDAFKWLRTDGAKKFNIDPDRIAVMGASAGGYLTLVTGYRVQPRPRALISLFGYGDLIGDWYSTPSPHSRHNRQKVTEEEALKSIEGSAVSNDLSHSNRGLFYNYARQNGLWPKLVSGWDPRSESDRFNPYMPVKNVTAEYPPTSLIHGTADTDVPYEQSEMMAREFKAKNVPFQFHTIPNGEHGLGGGEPREIQKAYHEAFAFLLKYLTGR